MITKMAKFHKCDRCSREEFADGHEKRVVLYHHHIGGRSFYLCGPCFRDVLNFCEGSDGPFDRIVLTKDGRRSRVDSLRDRISRAGGVHNG